MKNHGAPIKRNILSRPKCYFYFCGIVVVCATLIYQFIDSEDLLKEDLSQSGSEVRPHIQKSKSLEAIPVVEMPMLPSAGPAPPLVDTEHSAEILADLMPTEEQSRLLYEAEEAAVAKCMNERGFEYEPNVYESGADRRPWEVEVKPGDLQVAIELGYGIATSMEMDRMPMPAGSNDERLASMSPEAQQAWADAFAGPMMDSASIPDSGSWVTVEHPSGAVLAWDSSSCLSSARQNIYGDDVQQMHDEFAEGELRDQVAALIEDDAEYKQSLKSWRDCMSGNGYEYNHPLAATQSLQEAYSAGKLDISALQQREIEIATVDAKCHQASDMTDAFSAAKQRAEATVRATNGEQLESLKKGFQSALVRAQQLLPEEF